MICGRWHAYHQTNQSTLTHDNFRYCHLFYSQLRQYAGIKSVFFGRDFITVTKNNDESWHPLKVGRWVDDGSDMIVIMMMMVMMMNNEDSWHLLKLLVLIELCMMMIMIEVISMSKRGSYNHIIIIIIIINNNNYHHHSRSTASPSS